MDALNQAILAFLTNGSGQPTAAIAQHIERATRATRTRLIALIERNLIKEIVSGPRDPYRWHYLVNDR